MTASPLILELILEQSKVKKKRTMKQQKIIDAAIRLFAEKGYANTSTSEIALASGVAEATIFRHYQTKENLLLSLIVPFLKELLPIVSQQFAEEIRPEQYERLEDFLRDLLHNRLMFIKANQDVFKIVVKEVLYREELHRDLLPHVYRYISEYLNRALDRFRERGEPIDLPNDEVIKDILTVIASHYIWRFLLSSAADESEDSKELDRLVHLLLGGIYRRDRDITIGRKERGRHDTAYRAGCWFHDGQVGGAG